MSAATWSTGQSTSGLSGKALQRRGYMEDQWHSVPAFFAQQNTLPVIEHRDIGRGDAKDSAARIQLLLPHRAFVTKIACRGVEEWS